MHPLTFLAATLMVTLVAYLAHLWVRRHVAVRIGRLAAEWGMNYSQVDCFHLTSRVAGRFPIPGASDVKVTDLIYHLDGARLCYCFTVHYTAGVIRTKRRLRRAAAFSEPRDSRDAGSAECSPLVLAPAHLPLVEQYRQLNPLAVASAAPAAPLPAAPPVEARAPVAADAPAAHSAP